MAEQPDTIDPLFKLRNSPLQGVEAYRSPFYRRLLSAGYKGYVQGSLGGATLFAVLGAVTGGAIAAVGAAFAVGSVAFLAVPIMAGAGLLYGKDAFGTIGAVAAISAEQAEMSEKRRSLLDRYFETPSREEAKQIESLLQGQSEEKMPKQWFHWKAGLLGAAVVGLAAVGGIGLAAALSAELLKDTVLYTILAKGFGVAIGSVQSFAIAGTAGALAGSLIGIDRAYIRKWFDVQERFHDETEVRSKRGEHQQDVERLQQAYRAEGYGLAARGTPADINGREGPSSSRVQPVPPHSVAQPVTGGSLETTPVAEEKPKATIQASDAVHQQRVSSLSAPVAAL